jgi:hypothetical protein
MDQPTPTSQPVPAETPQANPNQVILEKKPDGTFTCNGALAKTIDEVLNMAREKLTGDDGGMSVEEAFKGGFRGSELPPGDVGY